MVTYSNTSDATTLINRVAAEVGLVPVTDPFSSNDAGFTQLTYLINSAGEELAIMHNWNMLRRIESLSVLNGTQSYALPTDLQHFYNDTFWDATNDLKVLGPLNASEWANMTNNGIITPSRLYCRVYNNQINFYPYDENRTVKYEYHATSWVLKNDLTTYATEVSTGTDIPLFHPTLMVKYLKLKFLTARRLPAAQAQEDFDQIFELLSAQDVPVRDIRMGGRHTYPYINPLDNVRDTNFGG